MYTYMHTYIHTRTHIHTKSTDTFPLIPYTPPLPLLTFVYQNARTSTHACQKGPSHQHKSKGTKQ